MVMLGQGSHVEVQDQVLQQVWSLSTHGEFNLEPYESLEVPEDMVLVKDALLAFSTATDYKSNGAETRACRSREKRRWLIKNWLVAVLDQLMSVVYDMVGCFANRDFLFMNTIQTALTGW
jgi:hypothetical protein